MKLFLLICISSILTSCTVINPTLKSIPLKGNYIDKPYEVKINKPFDEVWSNIIDLFATKGLSIKLIDKSSGLIVSEKTSFIDNYTVENRSGDLEKEDAYIIVEKKVYMEYNEISLPKVITGEWNIRIKKVGNNKTSLNVNLTNINATTTISGTQYNPPRTIRYKAKSTGEFEEFITELIK